MEGKENTRPKNDDITKVILCSITRWNYYEASMGNTTKWYSKIKRVQQPETNVLEKGVTTTEHTARTVCKNQAIAIVLIATPFLNFL